MQEPKAGKRIVSKGAYARRQGQRLFLATMGVVVCLAGFAIPIWLYLHFRGGGIVLLIAFVAFAGVTINRFGKVGKNAIKQARRIDPGVPLTRSNAADLPAPDSLVRASQEPVQAQEGVLLRAAAGEARSGQEEQLVRASMGGQE